MSDNRKVCSLPEGMGSPEFPYDTGITHAGVFHADDVFSAAFLRMLNLKIEILRRTKVPEGFEGSVPGGLRREAGGRVGDYRAGDDLCSSDRVHGGGGHAGSGSAGGGGESAPVPRAATGATVMTVLSGENT